MVKLYDRSRVPTILNEKVERLDPILRYFEEKGYTLRYKAGRLTLISPTSVVEFYLNQGIRVVGREHLVEGIIRTRQRRLVNGGRNFTVDVRHPEQAVKAIETAEAPYVLGITTEETETNMAEP